MHAMGGPHKHDNAVTRQGHRRHLLSGGNGVCACDVVAALSGGECTQNSPKIGNICVALTEGKITRRKEVELFCGVTASKTTRNVETIIENRKWDFLESKRRLKPHEKQNYKIQPGCGGTLGGEAILRNVQC